MLLARTTAQLQAVERELAEERVKLEYTEEEILEMERKEEQAEAVSERCARPAAPRGRGSRDVRQTQRHVECVRRLFGTFAQKSGFSRGIVRQSARGQYIDPSSTRRLFTFPSVPRISLKEGAVEGLPLPGLNTIGPFKFCLFLY